jgi:O-acetyl-ADP-ribose deacetylase (regulator of RNase III)
LNFVIQGTKNFFKKDNQIKEVIFVLFSDNDLETYKNIFKKYLQN